MPSKEKLRGVHGTARARRQIAMESLSRELEPDSPDSSAARLAAMLPLERPMIVSGDIDGIVAATMLSAVAPGIKIAAILMQSKYVLVQPDYVDCPAEDFLGVDVFSLRFDCLSNHVLKYGNKKSQTVKLREAFERWDAAVDLVSKSRFIAAPSLWANIQACYEDANRADSSKYKYPLGTAQILLALLEASGNGPKLLDRTYLPWLLANCDGGIETYRTHPENTSVWWPVMAGAVGPGSVTEQIFRVVETMRPHDFIDAVHRLERERGSTARFLNDDWNLANHSPETLASAMSWLCELTFWPDPVIGGLPNLSQWTRIDLDGGHVNLTFPAKKDDPLGTHSAELALKMDAAASAVNANFRHGGSGSRFNWVGGWPTS